MSIDWGNVPSWISAIGSLAAFGTAAWAGTSAWKQVKYSADQQRHRDERDEQSQASKVAAWIAAAIDKKGELEICIRYTNSSELPVYDLRIVPTNAPENDLQIGVVEPNDTKAKVRHEHLTAEARRIYQELLFEHWEPSNDDHKAARAIAIAKTRVTPIVISFRDTQNIVWRREANGLLRKGG